MPSLRFLFSFADLLFPLAAASFAVIVGFLFSAGFFPVPMATQGGEGFVGEDDGGGGERDEELSLGLRRKKMEERGERQVNRVALFFLLLRGQKRGRGATLQKVTVLP